jgi:hypothetical protein
MKSYDRASMIRVLIVFIMIAAIAFPTSPSQAEAISGGTREAVDSTIHFFRNGSSSLISNATLALPPQNNGGSSPQDRASRVTSFAYCPQRVILYTGEQCRLSPLPLDGTGNCVHGVACSWQTSNGSIAQIACDGTVTAMQAGQTSVTATIGYASTTTTIEVRNGPRPQMTDAQWDADHAQDCTGTASAPLVFEPDEPRNKPSAAKPFNATGHPRYNPNLAAMASSAGTDDQVGSSNFSMGIPIFAAPGRGVSAGVALVYNSRMWTKEGNTMVFDYDQGWPAPGFRLNYGRLVLNYDVASGLGNHLLIQPDGTRLPLIRQGLTNKYLSGDGQHIELDTSAVPYELTYPDGTVVKYEEDNNRWLPKTVEDVDGNSFSITYVNRNDCSSVRRVGSCTCGSSGTCSKPARQAIDRITDSLGRHYTFWYYGDGSLAEIHAPAYDNNPNAEPPDRTVAKFFYESVQLSYNFGSMQVEGVPTGGQMTALKRVFFPDTGHGYVFDEYSGYGMCQRVSMRLGMTDTVDGTTTAYTRYVYQTTGALSDAPRFAERQEWWQDKAFANGDADSMASVFTYGRTTDSTAKTATNTITSPANNERIEMVSNDDQQSSEFGLLKTHSVVDAITNAILFEQNYEYTDSSSQSGTQRTRMLTTPDNKDSDKTRTDMVYGTYGRLMEEIEFGFKDGGGFKKRRRTVYSYFDNNGDPSYLDVEHRKIYAA